MDSKVNIAFACDKQWCSMTILDNDTSRHCSHCNQNIVDLSTQSFFDEKAIHCGRFSLAQVNSIQRQFSINHLGALTFSLLSILGVTVEPQEAFGQLKVEQTTTKKPQAQSSVTLSGIVKDKETNEPLYNVTIMAKYLDSMLASTKTDFDGKFSFSIDTSAIKLDQVQIVFSSFGYKPDTLTSVNIPNHSLDQELTISLEARLDLDSFEIIEHRTMGLFHIPPIDTTEKGK